MRSKIIWANLILILCLFIYACDDSLEPNNTKGYLPELILINKNLTFTMGCLDSIGWYRTNDTEVPPFIAILDTYYIGKYEVRNDEFNYFVIENGYSDSTYWSNEGWIYIKSQNRSRPVDWIEGDEPWINCSLSNSPDRPINNITWYEAEAYCKWLSYKTGDNYSLPTEAQWERVARGPDPGRIFPWGNEDDQAKLNNMMYTSKLYPVGCFEAGKSIDGCYDLAGNLEEYCSDLFYLYIYQDYKLYEPIYNPSGPDSNSTGWRSRRGTFTLFYHIYEIERQITTFRRFSCQPNIFAQILGFRIVKNIKH